MDAEQPKVEVKDQKPEKLWVGIDETGTVMSENGKIARNRTVTFENLGPRRVMVGRDGMERVVWRHRWRGTTQLA